MEDVASSNDWTINYIPEEGGRYTGRLDVGASGHTVYRYSNKDEAIVELPVSDIAGVEARKKGIMKRALVHMLDSNILVRLPIAVFILAFCKSALIFRHSYALPSVTGPVAYLYTGFVGSQIIRISGFHECTTC